MTQTTENAEMLVEDIRGANRIPLNLALGLETRLLRLQIGLCHEFGVLFIALLKLSFAILKTPWFPTDKP